jgi:hypothetical protein
MYSVSTPKPKLDLFPNATLLLDEGFSIYKEELFKCALNVKLNKSFFILTS